jgi:hypothetical protein
MGGAIEQACRISELWSRPEIGAGGHAGLRWARENRTAAHSAQL